MAVKFKTSTMGAEPSNEYEAAPVAEAPTTPMEDVTTEPEVKVEVKEEPNNDEITFEMDAPDEEVKVVPQFIDWKEQIRSLDKKEIAKELGINDFAFEMADFMQKGGDPYQYLTAKAVDWTKISDEDVLRNDFEKKYPNLSPEQKSFLFNKQYGVSELDDDDTKQMKEIQKAADAYGIRQQKITEQKNFNIQLPTPVSKEAILNELQEQSLQQAETMRKAVLENPAIKSLIESKRVTVDAGDLGKFNIGVPNPKQVIDFMNDGNTYRKYTSNEKGEPDMEKAQMTALLNIMGVKKFINTFVDYGKQQSTKQVMEETRNVVKPQAPAAAHTQKVVWRTGKGIA
jgi:hypothetical protein